MYKLSLQESHAGTQITPQIQKAKIGCFLQNLEESIPVFEGNFLFKFWDVACFMYVCMYVCMYDYMKNLLPPPPPPPHTIRMDALDPNAYAAFQASSDLKDVVDRVMERGGVSGGAIKPTMMKTLSVRANIMTPVKPMLVRAWSHMGRYMYIGQLHSEGLEFLPLDKSFPQLCRVLARKKLKRVGGFEIKA